jgi:uncharacterized protein YbaR (Trm112 family)
VYIELIDLLRCPREHEESWLVAAFNKMQDRFVIEGRLGCPVCSATYPIAGGVADLRDSNEISEVTKHETKIEDETEAAVRIAAMLGLTRAGSVAVLEGLDAKLASTVSAIGEAKVISLNSAGHAEEAENVAEVRGGSRLPLASASVDGFMLGSTSSRDEKDIARVLKTGGRLVVPVDTQLVGSFRELARDESYIVAESTGPLLTLSR